MKVCVIGCGLRTPLLIHGLVHSAIDVSSIVLHDSNAARADLMFRMGTALAVGTPVEVSWAEQLAEAVQEAAFVISSIRVGDMETRARDERLAVDCGFAGQETTGPAGFAMALRTIPVAIQHARTVQRYAPGAWIINFTNPAGIITQALSLHTGARAVGICDTPAELIHQIRRLVSRELQLGGADAGDVECPYFGLNHLGWVRDIRVNGQSLLDRVLEDDQCLRQLYPADLFDSSLLRELRLIPTEYLYYYYYQQRAFANQIRAGVTRGEELTALNTNVLDDLGRQLESSDGARALSTYRTYLNRRNRSYMRLDGAAESAFEPPDMDWDPFEGATGYHRIAVDTIHALTATHPRRVVLNVANQGSIPGLGEGDVVEVPCLVDRTGARPEYAGPLPPTIRGLVQAVKSYELLTVQAAVQQRREVATFALMANPIVGSWELADRFLRRLIDSDPHHFSGMA